MEISINGSKNGEATKKLSFELEGEVLRINGTDYRLKDIKDTIAYLEEHQ